MRKAALRVDKKGFKLDKRQKVEGKDENEEKKSMNGEEEDEDLSGYDGEDGESEDEEEV